MLNWIHTYESYWLFLFLFIGLLIELHSNYVLRMEYKYDEQKDLEKKQKKTRTTKKTTQTKDGGTTTEESTEVTEPMQENKP